MAASSVRSLTPAETMAELITSGLALEPPAVNAALADAWSLLHGPQRYWPTERLVAVFRHADSVMDGPPLPDSGMRGRCAVPRQVRQSVCCADRSGNLSAVTTE